MGGSKALIGEEGEEEERTTLWTEVLQVQDTKTREKTTKTWKKVVEASCTVDSPMGRP